MSEFVGLGLPDRARRSDVATAVERALAVLGIAELGARAVDRLSVGQRRRAVVARALARDPVLLLLYEPFANLDQPTAVKLSADLDALRRDGLAILQVSHELQLCERHASHLALVTDGRVIQGPAEALLADERLRSTFGEAEPLRAP